MDTNDWCICALKWETISKECFNIVYFFYRIALWGRGGGGDKKTTTKRKKNIFFLLLIFGEHGEEKYKKTLIDVYQQ